MRVLPMLGIALAFSAYAADATDVLYPSYIRRHYPASIGPLLLRENRAQESCSSVPSPQQERACVVRDALISRLASLGWCFGPDEAISAERTWMRTGPTCHPG